MEEGRPEPEGIREKNEIAAQGGGGEKTSALLKVCSGEDGAMTERNDDDWIVVTLLASLAIVCVLAFMYVMPRRASISEIDRQVMVLMKQQGKINDRYR